MKRESETINLKVEDVDKFYSGFSDNDTKIVYRKIIDYIDDSAKAYSLKTPLNINIKIKNLRSNAKKEECATTLRKYYKNEINDIKREIKVTNIIALLLLGIGVLLLCALQFLINVHSPYILKTTMEIMTWVFMWEAVDVFFFRRTIKRMRLKKLTRIYNCNITII